MRKVFENRVRCWSVSELGSWTCGLDAFTSLNGLCAPEALHTSQNSENLQMSSFILQVSSELGTHVSNFQPVTSAGIQNLTHCKDKLRTSLKPVSLPVRIYSIFPFDQAKDFGFISNSFLSLMCHIQTEIKIIQFCLQNI